MTEYVPPWLLSAKTAPLPASVRLCARRRLLDRLFARPEERLVLIEAGAGFGKTCLLSQMRMQALADRAHVAWITLDYGDDLATLAAYLAFALQQGGFSTDLGCLLPGDATVLAPTRIAGTLLNGIERDGRRWLLVLDDAQKLPRDALSGLVEITARLSPTNLRVVMSCRENPGLNTYQQAIAGTLLHLGSQDLRLTAAEIGEALDVNLAGDDLEYFARHSAGWPAATAILNRELQVRKRGVQMRDTLQAALDQASRHFVEQVVKPLDAEDRGLIDYAAIADWITPDMIETANEGRFNVAALRRMSVKQGVLLQSSDNAREAYTVHPLIARSWTGQRPHAVTADQIQFCRKAADWAYRTGDRVGAINFSLKARDHDLALTYFNKIGGLTLYLQQGIECLQEMMTLLDRETECQTPRLHLARGLLAMKNGEIRRAKDFLDLALRQHQAQHADDDGQFELEAHLLGLLLTQYGCAPNSEAISDARFRMLLDKSAYDPALRSCLAVLQCLFHLQIGSFELACHFGENALIEAKRCRSLYEELHVYFHLGAQRMVVGNRDDAAMFYKRALDIARHAFPQDARIQFRSDVLLGELYWEFGELALAKKPIMRVLALAYPIDAPFDISMGAFKLASEYLSWKGGAHKAVTYLQRARWLAVEQGLDRLAAYVDALLVRSLFDADEPDEALLALNRLEVNGLGKPGQLTWREQEMFSLALIRSSVWRGAFAAAREHGASLLDTAQRTSNHRLTVRALVEQAAFEASQRPNCASEQLLTALCLVQTSHYIRPFVDRFAAVHGLIDTLAESDPHVRSLCQTIRRIAHDRRTDRREASPLTDRQLEVLAELCKGAPDKRIARTLSLTRDGVRYHLKAIYAHLSVRERSEAVRRARELNLVR